MRVDGGGWCEVGRVSVRHCVYVAVVGRPGFQCFSLRVFVDFVDFHVFSKV